MKYALALLLLAAMPVSARTRMWTGAVSNLWSEPRNWSPAGPPRAGDALLFPPQSLNREMSNDLDAVTLAGITVVPTPRPFPTLSGKAVTLTGDVRGGGIMIFKARLKIAAPVTLASALPLGGIDGGSRLILDSAGLLGVSGSGDFSGTIGGTVNLDNASLPRAAIEHARSLAGRGTVGDVTIDPGSTLDPGGNSECCRVVGTLRTRSLVMKGNLLIDVDRGSSDRLQVNGTVTLGGFLTAESLLNGAWYEPFTIIDNDGTDPVIGTFADWGEGSVLPVGPYGMQITYRGGDGNDVVLTNLGLVGRLWTGRCSSFWTNPCNWSPAYVPVPGLDNLIFAGDGKWPENDFPPGTTFLQLIFTGGSFGGNLLRLGRSIAVRSAGRISAPVKLGPSLLVFGDAPLELDGGVDFDGETLTAKTPMSIHQPSGDGALIAVRPVQVYSGSFRGTASGDLTLTGSLSAPAALPAMKVIGNARLQGSGTVAEIAVDANGGIDPGDPERLRTSLFEHDWTPVGTIRTPSLSLAGRYDVDLVGGDADALQVTGAVALSGDLAVHAVGALVGKTLTIIDNDGADPVRGAFRDLPEGTVFDVEGATLRITYRGGDGNDVALTVLSAEELTLTLSQSKAVTQPGEPFTLTATLSPAPRFSGFARFGNLPVDFIGGTATIDTSLNAPADALRVVWSSTPSGASSVSSTIAHDVRPAETSALVGVFTPAVLLGQTVEIVVAVRAELPATAIPAGRVSLFAEDRVLLAREPLVDGFAVVHTAALPAGTHTITAVYDGGDMFQPSVGTAGITVVASPVRERPSRH